MRGRIYSKQKCPVCGGSFTHDERRRGLFCKIHPNQEASKGFIIRFGRDITKRARTYPQAERILDGLRWEVDRGTFDPRDYKKDNPLGFETLAIKWLSVKEKEISRKHFNNLKNYMKRAVDEWGQRNIKTIQYGEIEDFLYGQELSDKTKSNMKSCLHSFWTWIKRRRILTANQMPEFPEIKFELGWRQTIPKETQERIIEEIQNISYDTNPKIWIGIKWLATYISIRPGELLKLRERDIDIESGYIIMKTSKEKKPKLVPMIDEDIEILKNFPPALPELPFFRHPAGISGCRPGQKFGQRYLYKWWKKACRNIGIEGIDMYGGTRHSTALALREVATPEEIRRATMHSTNKAFERYFRIEADEVRDIYKRTRNVQPEQHPNNRKGKDKTGKVLKFK